MGVLMNTASGINSPRSQLIQIETLVLIGIVVLFLLHVLGSYRRQAVKLIVWFAYTVSCTLVSYTIGLMQSYHSGSGLFAVSAVCLLLILGNVDSLSAYSLNDNDNWKRIYIQQLVQFFWFGWILGQYGEREFYGPLWIIYIIAVFTTSTLTTSFRVASKNYNLADCTKWVADYMRYEHEQRNGFAPNPLSMHGYRYVVTGETEGLMCKPQQPDYLSRFMPNDSKLVTVEEIWNCRANLLSPEYRESSRLKDICLSMALSKMLNRRFAGFHLAESKLEKTRDFVFQGLLSGDDRYERAFRVTEVELGFVHDFFYTKYYVLFASHLERSEAVIYPALAFPCCLWLSYLLFERFQAPQDKQIVSTTKRRNYDALVTMAIVLEIAMLQLLQLYFYIASDWFKVHIICKYVKRPTWQISSGKIEKSIAFVVSRMKTFRYWENRLGQYSLLDSFNYTPKYNTLCRLTFGLVERTKIGRKKKTISLTSETKKAVIDKLVQSSGRLTNGATSLGANGAEQLMWACTDLPTLTHSILVWHIATTLREHSLSGEVVEMVRTHYSVASSLSGYCAYLVVFAPNLLRDHKRDTETIFDAVVREAREHLKGKVTMQQQYETLMSWNTDQEDKRLIVMGARLGKQLIEGITDPMLRWKILSEFWAEIMLYVVPSSDATSHLETMPRGGEFITHLWALVTHAGILDRDDSFGTNRYV